jgi:hypothetical protein
MATLFVIFELSLVASACCISDKPFPVPFAIHEFTMIEVTIVPIVVSNSIW